MSIDLKRKVPLTFHSLSGVKRWHDELSIASRNRALPVVKIPKDSRFKSLTLPEDCIRLTNRKMFVEEGNYQHNCVASYIDSVNSDECSIWSMRKSDGKRYTIEISMDKNHKYRIRQMLGFDNTEAPQTEIKRVREHIKQYSTEN